MAHSNLPIKFTGNFSRDAAVANEEDEVILQFVILTSVKTEMKELEIAVNIRIFMAIIIAFVTLLSTILSVIIAVIGLATIKKVTDITFM